MTETQPETTQTGILTLQQLKDMKPDTIFAKGMGFIEHPWFNDATPVEDGGSLSEDGKSTLVRWVAIRGGYHDWAIYHSMDANIEKTKYFDGIGHLVASHDLIARCGAKLHNEDKVREFVPCDDEAFKMYRH